ncbi:phage tail protein [Amphibacillus sp. Q70]|uniref:phage tail protein n=1 Tax=Amphibacillus sp. Q70 TaxID=3453416 RepID=UPI003F877F4D
MDGFRFLGLHTYDDFGVTLAPGKSIGFPDKNKIKVQVPFSNTEYDFSELYGEETYTSRTLTYSLNVFNNVLWSKDSMNVKKTKIINWLMSSRGKQKLYDDAFPGYYFLAEVEGQSSFQENYRDGILTVTFTAYPFMISELQEGHDMWDEFNFELDVAQQVDFNVTGSLNVVLHNIGTPSLTPKIKASSPMTIKMDDKTYNVPTGESKSENFVLNAGKNDLIITGNGSISFEFYKELI